MSDATLKDVTVSPNPADAAVTPEPVKQDAAPVVDATKDAAELGQILLDSGYTRDQINDLLAAPQALNAIRYQIENDPAEFIKGLERANPKIGENLLEKASDLYLQRYAPKDTPKAGAAKGEVPTELMAEVQAMKEELSSFRTAEQKRQQAGQMAQITARYEARVNEMLNAEPIKKLNLTSSEQKAMRALLDKSLAADPTVVQRVSNGNFIDVPRQFQAILNDWTADKKAAIDSEKSARERSSSNSSPMVFDGPNPFSLENVPATAFDSWDNTEDAFAAALKQASR